MLIILTTCLHLSNQTRKFFGKLPTPSYIDLLLLPLLKKGNLDPTIPSNYRPISNLSTISKIIERLVHSRITSHVSSSPNFNHFQSAYRKHHSTETTLLRITDSLRNICATGHAAVLVSLDLSAAFDTLDHNILIDILNRHFNISELALSWFRSYLTQRSQFVKMDNFSSSLTSLNSGVPQSSVLRPILFSLYKSPMCSIIVQHDLLFHQFADDITLFTGVSHPDPSPTLFELSSCLSALNSWFSQSQLKLNPTKSEVMFVGISRLLAKYNLPSVVTLDGTTLPISSKLKILSVTLDLNLNFAYFISQINPTSNFHIYAIKQVRKFLPLSTANALFISLVLSKLDYFNSLLCGQSNYLLCKLQAPLTNHAVKTVLQADYFSSFSDCLDRLHWLPVSQRCNFKLLWLIAFTLKLEQPDYLLDLLSIRHTRQPLRSLHSGLQLHQPVSSGLFTSRSFSHQAPGLWNSLPSNLRSSPSLMNFCKLLKTHLYHKHP